MYSACLFCNRALGANEAIEPFPIGRRLAFDAAKGRLWVVCPSCARWNLSPFDERWEAIEECERRFRGTLMRTSTPNIGLARLRDGTELVRIGRPLRPELAAWRYGVRFGRRFRRAAFAAGAGGMALAGATAAGFAAPALALGGAAAAAAWLAREHGALVRVAHGGRVLAVTRSDLAETRLTSLDGEDAWALRLRHRSGSVEIRGAAAMRTLARVLARLNGLGARGATVDQAVAQLEIYGDRANMLATMARHSERAAAAWRSQVRRFKLAEGLDVLVQPYVPLAIATLPREGRLALEMALNEEDEARALAGELAELERAWREAEEIAAIADDLLLPSSVLDAPMLRGRRTQ